MFGQKDNNTLLKELRWKCFPNKNVYALRKIECTISNRDTLYELFCIASIDSVTARIIAHIRSMGVLAYMIDYTCTYTTSNKHHWSSMIVFNLLVLFVLATLVKHIL